MALKTGTLKNDKYHDPRRPVAIWKSEDLLGDKSVASLTVILRTIGCRWNRCTMCGYASEGAPATVDDLLMQFAQALQRVSPDDKIIKIYTSGSFLDPREVPEAARNRILDTIREKGIERLVIESRPEHITPERVNDCLSKVETEFAIGLETSSDLIRENIIRKGFSFSDFTAASEMIHDHGGRVKAYLLLKPPMLSEGGALLDAISSARAARPYADTLSLNLCNIQRGTYVERLWERGEYRPPWLWSAVEILKSVDGPIICDPVGAGTKRGPHNCGKCDASISEAIRKHAITQESNAFDGLDCKCRKTWQKVMDLEEHSFGTVLD
ncbi:MAG: archaeosine biosynthesis radical SAM protein RaSEA [Methanotrichaceae archaeon]